MTEPAVWFPAIRCGSGADVFTERLCRALNEQGIRAEITWLPHRAEYAPWSVPVPKPPAWANVVHINSWLPPRFVPAGLPVVATVHSSVHDPALLPYKSRLQALYHKHWIHPIEAANLKRADCVIAVSHYTAAQVEMSFGVHDIQVIHNGIDCQMFTPITRNAPNRPFRLLYVGNWRTLKGVDLLAPIMERLSDDFILQYTADRNGAHRRFSPPSNSVCLGRLSGKDLVRAYQNADALIFPSRLEGFGLVAAEAMACGLPVIAARTSSLPEVVEDEVTGFLCPRDDVIAFVAQIRRLAKNPAAWYAMRQAARQHAINEFDEQIMVLRYGKIYGDVMN
jgi:glycosyltransferase involved in cell wall biosynthesis